MTPSQRNYLIGRLMVIWARTIEEHKNPDFDAWLSERHRRGGESVPPRITIHHRAA